MADELEIFKMLIIEDSPTAMEEIKMGAAKVPFPIRFSSCQTGSEAVGLLDRLIEIAEKHDDFNDFDRPDLIVLDMEIPEPHGLTILEKIKTNAALKNIPVLVNTGSANFQYMMKAKAYERVFYERKALGNGEKICEMAVKVRKKMI